MKIRLNPLHRIFKSSWICSGLAAICVSFLLFSLMPVLREPIGKHSIKKKLTVKVNAIDISEPDTPAPPEEPEPQKPLPKQIHLVPLSKAPKMAKPKLSLALEDDQKMIKSPFTIDISASARAAISNIELPNFYKTGDLDQPLITLKRVPPLYPIRAKQQKIQGYVRTQFVVNIHGTVNEINIIESNPPGVFDQSVIACISGWRFLPGTVGGEPVNILAETTLNFRLEQNN